MSSGCVLFGITDPVLLVTDPVLLVTDPVLLVTDPVLLVTDPVFLAVSVYIGCCHCTGRQLPVN
jgi:hypothetical protein